MLPGMATWDDVRELALAMPQAQETERRGTRAWSVGRGFVWERPLRAKDVEEVGQIEGPILAARVAHEAAKRALLAEDAGVFFTTAHFDGYPAVLIRLDRISRARLSEIVIEAWSEIAPRAVVREYLEEHPSTLE